MTMCDQHDRSGRVFPGIDLALVPERFREQKLCRICSYIFRECENMGQLNCRFHPKKPEPTEDQHGNITSVYPCCGIVARTRNDDFIGPDVYSDGCTACDHLAMDDCTVTSLFSEVKIQLPRDIDTPFLTDKSRSTYKRIYDIDLLEVFPVEMSRKFGIPMPHPDLIVRSFRSKDEYDTWISQSTEVVRTTVGGSNGRHIEEPRSRIAKNSLGVHYLRVAADASRPATESELTPAEVRRAKMQAMYRNTWKETVPHSETTALFYSRPEDFFRHTTAAGIEGGILLYQRGLREKGVLWDRRGKATGIVI